MPKGKSAPATKKSIKKVPPKKAVKSTKPASKSARRPVATPPQLTHPPGQNPQFPDTFYQDPMGLDRYVVQEKTLFAWRSPSKIEKQRSLTEKKQLFLIVLFIILVLVLLSEWMFALIFGLLCFVYSLLAAAPPSYIECSVTTLGIKVSDKYYFWPDMSQFWWEEVGEHRILYLRVVYPELQTLRLVAPRQDQAQLQTTIGTYLLYKKPHQTRWDKLTKTVAAKLPVDLEFLQL